MNFFKKKTKVYCKDCKYFIRDEGYKVCDHKKNVDKIDDWYSSHEIRKRRPKEINKRNNCKWFKNKESITKGDLYAEFFQEKD